MGSATSRRMQGRDDNVHESSGRRQPQSEEDSDTDSNIATVLNYLIRSGQVHIISSELQQDSDDEAVPATSPSLSNHKPDTEILDRSEISTSIKQSCGLLHSRVHQRPTPLPSLLNSRERGMFSRNHFTCADRVRISNNYLPRKMKKVANYHKKAFCGTYSADGSVFLSACQDGNLRLYDTSNGRFKLFRSIQAKDVGWSILDTAFSPDGNYLVYSSWSEFIHLCNIYGDYEKHEAFPLCPEERRFCVFSLVFSQDGREILGGASDGCLYVCDRECQQRCLRIDAHDDDVNSVAFADATSQILYSGSDDGLCKVWDRRTLNESDPHPVGVLAGHMDGLTYVDPRRDGRHLITNCKDQCIKLWDMRVFSAAKGQESTRKAVAAQNWDYRWQQAPKKLTCPQSRLEGDTSVMTYRGHSVLHTLIRCHFSPEATTGQRYIYTGCAAGKIIIYDVLTGEIEAVLSGHRSCVRDISWHPWQQELVSTSWDGTLGKWTYSSNDEEDTEKESKPLRRSQRIAQQKEKAASRGALIKVSFL